MAKSDWDPDYKLPGNKVVNLCLFWATNYKINSSLKTIEQAEKRLKEHNIGINIYPSRNYTKSHIIDVGDEAIPPQDYDKLRRKAAAVFDDQKTTDKIQRLPIIFCEFVARGYGLTVLRGKNSSWLAYCLVSQTLNQDYSTLIHEIGHAAANNGQHSPQKSNFMHESSYPERTIMVKAQIQLLARAYFVR